MWSVFFCLCYSISEKCSLFHLICLTPTPTQQDTSVRLLKPTLVMQVCVCVFGEIFCYWFDFEDVHRRTWNFRDVFWSALMYMESQAEWTETIGSKGRSPLSSLPGVPSVYVARSRPLTVFGHDSAVVTDLVEMNSPTVSPGVCWTEN